jgi:heptosyltransferase-2
MTERAQNILIRGVNWIGDAVMTIPAIRGVRRLLPESRITLLIQEPLDQLFASFSVVDGVHGFSVRPGIRGLVDRVALAARLRKERFDLCLILPNSFDSALVPFLSGIPERIGFDRDGRRLLLTKWIAAVFKGSGRRQAGDYLTLLAPLGSADIPLDCCLEIDPEARQWAEKTVAPLRRTVRGPLIGVSPGAAYGPAKMWFPERFASLAGRLCAERQAGVVLVGDPSERALCEEIGRALQAQALNFAGQTSLPQLAAVLAQCDLFISNDSGPMHLASAVGTPVVAIFGSTDPAATGPLGKHEIVKKECDCAPCWERVCPRGDTLCMKRIEVTHVLEAVDRLLPRQKEVHP